VKDVDFLLRRCAGQRFVLRWTCVCQSHNRQLTHYFHGIWC